MGLIGRNHNLIGQFLKGLKVERTKKGYSVSGFAEKKGVQQEYGKKKKGGVELTSGTMKLMAISPREEQRIEDSEDCWRRFLPELLKFSSSAAAREMGLRL